MYSDCHYKVVKTVAKVNDRYYNFHYLVVTFTIHFLHFLIAVRREGNVIFSTKNRKYRERCPFLQLKSYIRPCAVYMLAEHKDSWCNNLVLLIRALLLQLYAYKNILLMYTVLIETFVHVANNFVLSIHVLIMTKNF